MISSRKSVLGWLTEPPKALRNILLLSILLVPLIGNFLVLPSAQALTVNSARDCDNNAVINCGAISVNELQRKFNNNSSTRAVFRSFGISSSDIKAMDSTAVSGEVTRSGQVIVNGKTIATDAMTAGMQNMPGSQRVTNGNTTFFTRPPSVSFVSSPLPAFVVIKNGQFQFAIIASCGNPVKATPVVKKITKTKVAQPVTATPTPTPPTQIQAQQQSQTVNVVTPPAPTPAVAATTPATPRQLPTTGPGDVIGFGSFVTLLSGTAHYLYRRSKFGLR